MSAHRRPSPARHRATPFTRKANRASRHVVRLPWLVEQPSWCCLRFTAAMTAVVVSLGVIAAGFGGVHVEPLPVAFVSAGQVCAR